MQNATITCPAGIRNDNGATVIWIRSPRTGRTIDITERMASGLPQGVRGRVIASAARGCHAVAFTRDELQAIAELHRQAMQTLTPRTGGLSFGRPSRSMSGR